MQVWTVQLPVRGHVRPDPGAMPVRPLLPHHGLQRLPADLLRPESQVHEHHSAGHRQPHARQGRARGKWTAGSSPARVPELASSCSSEVHASNIFRAIKAFVINHDRKKVVGTIFWCFFISPMQFLK